MSSPPTPAAGTERANGRITREQLITAAVELMAEGGEAAVNLKATAQRAGVTRGTAYYHFKSRAALIEQMHANLEQQLLKLTDASRPFSNPYSLVSRLAAEDESIIRSRVYRILEQGPLADPTTMAYLRRFRSAASKQRMRQPAKGDPIDPDALAFIASALDFAGLMAISQGKTVKQRKELADRFGEAVYQLFCHGVIDPELDPDLPKPTRKT
ncbi:TetR/AcrR family transcriptional regulator [Pseudomonas sp. PB120]|uniref:TetR/AcrR family transcriptional regulator n=1 Tax=Pseudomonas sp. PB120 TaxID=2494700 RepID=UPI0012FDE1D5|nr:TetR/AcrR family transcriptional regulator [Pseudomonas sp. PB120]MVV48851.1 TetR/AcrR family transcriptional regulator [Pseudomonas sp. PB120]